jgi:hypothetical protein
MEKQTPAPPHIKRASFLQAAYRCKNKDNWFIYHTISIHECYLPKKRRDKVMDEWNSMLIMPNDEHAFWRNIDGNVANTWMRMRMPSCNNPIRKCVDGCDGQQSAIQCAGRIFIAKESVAQRGRAFSDANFGRRNGDAGCVSYSDGVAARIG